MVAPSKSASMGRKFIPNWRRANSPTSTRFSRRSKGNSDRNLIPVGGFDFLARIPAGTSNTEHRTSNNRLAVPLPVGSSTFNVGCSMFGRHFPRRVMGAWWPPRSSKPSSARFTGRGRFDSCPLRHFDLRFTIYDPGIEEPTRAAVSAGLCINRKSQLVNPEEGGGRRVARTDS